MMGTTAKSKLKLVPLGSTGVQVSELCLGAMTFGKSPYWTMPTISDKEAFALMDRYAEVGGNFIDTANIYSRGDSERVVGEWVASRGNRENFIIATKFGFGMGDDANLQGGSRRNIFHAIDASLRSLGMDYVDLYQIHHWDRATPVEETLRALSDLVRIGKVRYIGCSNFTGWQLQKAADISRRLGIERFMTVQNHYSLLGRGIEMGALPVCEEEKIACLAWSPLNGGWLTGRYKRGDREPEQGSRVEWAQKSGWGATDFEYISTCPQTWPTVDAVQEVAKAKQCSPATVALRWLMQSKAYHGVHIIPIIGARRLAHLDDNLNAAFVTLSEADMDKLTRASAMRPFYDGNSYLFFDKELRTSS